MTHSTSTYPARNYNDLWRTPSGTCPYHHAVKHRKVDRIVELALYGNNLNPNIPDEQGRTPLHNAVLMKDESLTSYMAKVKNVNANACDNEGNTPLRLAIISGKIQLIWALVCVKGAVITDEDIEAARTLASKEGGLEFSKKLEKLLLRKRELDVGHSPRTSTHILESEFTFPATAEEELSSSDSSEGGSQSEDALAGALWHLEL